MPRRMTRGKHQILFNILPERTFDFDKVAVIARVSKIRGVARTDLNASVLLRRIEGEAKAWISDLRPALRDEVLRDPSRFVLIDPGRVEAEMFPRVFWCQNGACGRIFDHSGGEDLPSATCRACKTGALVQMRFIRIHRCGAVAPLVPFSCPKCKSSSAMALDTRKSERVSNFTWICRKCTQRQPVLAGMCNQCRWPNPAEQKMDIVVHRAGRSYYAQVTTLLNIPNRNLDGFFALKEWPAIAAAKYFQLPEVAGKTLTDFRGNAGSGDGVFNLSSAAEQQLAAKGYDPKQIEKFKEMFGQLATAPEKTEPAKIAEALERRTGIPPATWDAIGQEMMDAVMPLETGRPKELFDLGQSPAEQSAKKIGLSGVKLVSDYPILTATYGYSRAEYSANACRLNPFPPDADHGGKYPIFVDQIQADALMISLDPKRVCDWIQSNGFGVDLAGSDRDAATRACFVPFLNGIQLRETIKAATPQARLAFGLLHTISHLMIRKAALLCGLDRESMSEYLLPRAGAVAIYCNHRFGATIGALTSLFEQSLEEWLNLVRDSRTCVYDPVCKDRTGNCHACVHLAETSCRYFNMNLSRSFLFGGPDSELGNVQRGYFV